MQIIELLSDKNKDYYLNELKECQWWAAKYLYNWIVEEKMEEMFGENPRVFLLVEEEIISFCTYVHQDEIHDPSMYPWIGFVYTYPKHRGHHHFKKLLDHIVEIAKMENHNQIFLSTNETSLYEKYGFDYYKNMKDFTGNDSRIYIFKI